MSIVYFMTDQPFEAVRFFACCTAGLMSSFIAQSIGLAIGIAFKIEVISLQVPLYTSYHESTIYFDAGWSLHGPGIDGVSYSSLRLSGVAEHRAGLSALDVLFRFVTIGSRNNLHVLILHARNSISEIRVSRHRIFSLWVRPRETKLLRAVLHLQITSRHP